jgi:hypothetical protein
MRLKNEKCSCLQLIVSLANRILRAFTDLIAFQNVHCDEVIVQSREMKKLIVIEKIDSIEPLSFSMKRSMNMTSYRIGSDRIVVQFPELRTFNAPRESDLCRIMFRSDMTSVLQNIEFRDYKFITVIVALSIALMQVHDIDQYFPHFSLSHSIVTHVSSRSRFALNHGFHQGHRPFSSGPIGQP